MLRIVSLIASASEIVASLGLSRYQVGRSHECDFPPEILTLPICTAPAFPTDGSSAEIDQRVKQRVANALSVYEVSRELLDALQVKATNLYSKLTLPEVPMLFVEFHGSDAGVAEQSQRFGEIAAELGGGPFDWATRAEDRSRLWQARHDAAWALRSLRATGFGIATDVCVPISRLAECVTETQRDIADSNLLAPIVGHVGDGNFHVALTVDLNDKDEVARINGFLERLVERALAMDGTCTGEHGIGQGKMKYMAAEHGEPALAAMRSIKRALDPLDIMNPGKIVSL